MERKLARVAVSLILSFLLIAGCSGTLSKNHEVPYKVYVMMGFHTSFYHSWRGDSNDEAGFGTDIRVVRGILKILKQAENRGLDARGYWDIDGYFTLERIIPENALDIIEGIRARVEAGLDETLPAPYNNGIISAHTPCEMYRAVAWTIENPWGSGVKQVFGSCTPIFRPQESMTTTGMIPILKKAGINGIILPYSALPFTSIAAFVKPLDPGERYGTFWLKHSTGPERLAVIPCYSPADALDYGSFELWLRELRKMQVTGKVESDLVLHYNFDADSETWLPMELPYGIGGLPNTRGLIEIIEAVNKYPWATFTTPGEFLRNHPPQKEITVLRDTADGSFDGYYSWAEKCRSHIVWTSIEQSRMYSYRTDALSKRLGENASADLREKLWSDRGSSFWYRLLAMSTTHFGMSTPIINEERQKKAYQISTRALDIAYDAFKKAARAARPTGPRSKTGAQYVVSVFNYPRVRNGEENRSQALVRIPVIFDMPARPIVTDASGKKVHASLIEIQPFEDGTAAGEVTFVESMSTSESKTFTIDFKPLPTSKRETGKVKSLDNGVISVLLSENSGIELLRFAGRDYGKTDFLDPFITYKTGKKPATYKVSKWELVPMENETFSGLQRSRLVAEVPIKTPEGIYTARFTYTFSLYDALPFLIVDVEADYPYTPPRDLIQTIQQKLRRLLDLRWIEVGPFQIHPDLSAPEQNPITIWKHNYLGVISTYRLDYGQINPKNSEIDSFNHQITNGWVAMENGEKGLLIAQDAEVSALFAFAPMRLTLSKDRMQQLFINPFGTYFGRQLDYSHTGSNGTGALMTIAVGAHLRPSGPSWNGKSDRFRIMLAPYEGGEPPENTRKNAMAFFYPYGVVYHRSSYESDDPQGDEVVTAQDMRNLIKRRLREKKLADPSPLPPPGALLANPAESAIDLVWDAPRDERITGFEVRWKKSGSGAWNVFKTGATERTRIPNLENGNTYEFTVRSLSVGKTGEWAPQIEGIPGRVNVVDYSHETKKVPLKLLRKLLAGILKHKILLH